MGRRMTALLILALLALAAPPARAQETPPDAAGEAGGGGAEEKAAEEKAAEAGGAKGAPETLQVNFNNVSLREIIKAMEKITGKRLLFDEALVADKKTSLFSSEAIPLSEVLAVFRSILEVEGLALVRTGAEEAEIYKIVDMKTALQRPTPTFTKDTLAEIRPGDQVVTLLFELRHIEPMEVAPVLGSLATLPEGIVAIPGTKLVRITDFADNIKRIVSILELVDREGPKVRTETLRLENVDPLQLAAEMQPLIQIQNRIAQGVVAQNIRKQVARLAKKKGPGTVVQFSGGQYTPITVIPIARLGAIVVTAEEKQMGFVRDLVARLDVMDPDQKVLKYYELEHAAPSALAQVVSKVFGISVGGASDPRARGGGKKGKKGAAPQQRFEKVAAVIPDDELGKLIVVAPAKTQADIAEVVASLDVLGPRDDVLRYYEVRNSDLHETARILSQLFGLALDSDMSRVQRWMNRNRGRRPQRLAVSKVIIPDENLHTLLVVADLETHRKLVEALARIDVTGAGRKKIRFHRLEHADPEAVASTLGHIFDITVSQAAADRGSRWWRRRRGPAVTSKADKNAVIVPDPEQHQIIVVAAESVQEEIAGIIADLDTRSPDENVLCYYPVEHTDIHEAARVVSQVFGLELGSMAQARNPRGRGRSRRRTQAELTAQPVVIPDEALSTLIVVAPQKLQDDVKKVVDNIDAQGPGEKVVRYYRIASGEAGEIAQILGNIFGISVGETATSRRQWWRRRADDQRTEKNAIILPNEELSTIVVVASERTQKEVEEVVRNLDVEGPGSNVLRYYPVRYTDIAETANILSQIYGIQVGSPSTAHRARYRWWNPPSASDKLTKERVIIPDDNLNAILVVAPPEVQEEIGGTVEKLDTLGPRDNELRFYEVDNEFVAAAAQTLSQLFNIPLGQTSRRRSRGRQAKSTQKFGVDPVIIPDENLGSVIVNAPQDIHQEIQKVLLKLDFLGNQERMTIQFYKLKNTDAETVARTLGGLFDITVSVPSSARRASSSRRPSSRSRTPRPSSSRRRVEGGGSGGPLPVGTPDGGTAGDEEEEKDEEEDGAATAGPSRAYAYTGQPVVVPDANLNSLIVIAANRLHDEMASVIEKLDVRRPQVLFEIAIIDITTDSDLSFGIEYGTLDGASENPRGHGFTNFGLGQRSSSSGAGFPDVTAVPTGTQGLFAGVTKNATGSIPLLVHALKVDSDVNIRATPILLVNDNEDAAFSALRSEPTTHTSQGTATTNISFSGFVDAGTVLELTPHVSEGNYIRLEIMVQVDSWIGTSATPGIPPPKATNYLQTSITVPNEHVVIIGGLTSREKSVRQDKVPLLGDIPLLGYLFRHEVTEEKVKKLFLFIKPVILSDRGFIDLNRISDEKLAESRLLLAGGRKTADGDGAEPGGPAGDRAAEPGKE